MEFSKLVEIVGDEPVFETGLLLAGEVEAAHVRRQLSRWTRAGLLRQVRRGLYTLAPPFQKVKPHPFLLANRMARGSYVSCHAALAYYGLIPEYVPVTTSVTRGRPAQWRTAYGRFEFRHLHPNLLYGYRLTELVTGQDAFVALPEKALLDLVHLHPGSDSPAYLRELRLQNLAQLDLDTLQSLAARSRKPKWQRAADLVARLTATEASEYENL